jgi:hypothetical protein
MCQWQSRLGTNTPGDFAVVVALALLECVDGCEQRRKLNRVCNGLMSAYAKFESDVRVRVAV